MIGHGIAFYQHHLVLPTQIAQNLPDPLSHFAVELLPAVLWYNRHMAKAFPLHVGLASSIFRDGPPGPSGPSSRTTV